MDHFGPSFWLFGRTWEDYEKVWHQKTTGRWKHKRVWTGTENSVAWGLADESTRDAAVAALKRKFEQGLHSGDVLQFFRLHARKDNSGYTVAQARRFAETQEAINPKKSLRILQTGDRDHSAGVVPPERANFQPLLDGFEKIIQTVLNDRT